MSSISAPGNDIQLNEQNAASNGQNKKRINKYTTYPKYGQSNENSEHLKKAGGFSAETTNQD